MRSDARKASRTVDAKFKRQFLMFHGVKELALAVGVSQLVLDNIKYPTQNNIRRLKRAIKEIL